MLNALIEVCNKHRPDDANWIEVHPERHAALAQIHYKDGTVSTLLDTTQLVQLAEVLIQSATVRAIRETCNEGK